MAIIKCKMCGGDIELSADKTYGTCEYCGSTVTLPRVNDQRMENLFNRANHFRMTCEFDKAVATYDMILNEDDANAEAHWGLLISRFGIEYVEDPVSHERIPTSHRIQKESILADSDYLATLKHAPDAYTRTLYEQEGKRLAELQRGMLAVSAQSEPYDIFICYKETDANGNRTKDSALAQDIYHQLTNAGYRVFFARVSLEDKLGQQYEPHIFAALNSAKVMLVLGTDPEYFNAVWVKNEWSRFLALARQDRSKVLIPCYRDINVYDLPDELSLLQSQDMGKIGFMQDLLHGVQKLLKGAVVETAPRREQNTHSGPTISALLERVNLFLEDGKWQEAEEYCERILDQDPHNATAYADKLMIKLKVTKMEDLPKSTYAFEEDGDYQKALRYSSGELKRLLEECPKALLKQLDAKYQKACRLMERACTEKEYLQAAESFGQIAEYAEASDKQRQCEELAEEEKKKKIYETAVGSISKKSTIPQLQDALRTLRSLGAWKDAPEKRIQIEEQVQMLAKKLRTKRGFLKFLKFLLTLLMILLVLLSFALFGNENMEGALFVSAVLVLCVILPRNAIKKKIEKLSDQLKRS